MAAAKSKVAQVKKPLQIIRIIDQSRVILLITPNYFTLAELNI